MLLEEWVYIDFYFYGNIKNYLSNAKFIVSRAKHPFS
jgi:hypothetical protein